MASKEQSYYRFHHQFIHVYQRKEMAQRWIVWLRVIS